MTDTDGERLRRLKAALDNERAAKRSLLDTVWSAWQAGASWTEISEVLGVTRQAARETWLARFAVAGLPTTRFKEEGVTAE